MRTFHVPTPVRNTDNTYFEEGKKGELNQIKKLFQITIGTDDHQSRNKLIKTIIAYTTLGVDTSRFFPEMILASYTNDITEKKLIYFYLSIYAEKYPDTAIMVINTFYKDCIHSDPRIRGLSLKSLCNLKFKGAYEYIYPCLQDALVDRQPYVRRSAVLGIAKVFRISPQIKDNAAIIEKLYTLIKDDDRIVAANSIQTLNQILSDDGGIILNEKVVAYLLNNINFFSQFSQSTILDTIQKYTPSDDNQLIAIMNILDSKLKHMSSAIVLGTIKIFLKYTAIKENLRRAIIQRIQRPLLFLVTSQENFEVQYIVLEHIRYLVLNMSCVDLFLPYYKTFFCLHDEPTYIRSVKIQILQELTSSTNISDIINELDEYMNQEQVISRIAIKALGSIAMKVELEYSRLVMKIMLKKVEFGKSWVCNEIMEVLQNIIRKYPEQFNIVKVHLSNLILFVNDNTAKASLLSIISRSQIPIPEIVEYIETLVSNQSAFHQFPYILKKQLLNSTLGELFKSPSFQLKDLLAKLFQLMFSSETEINIKDLASLYYKAMQADISQFKSSFLSHRQFIPISVHQPIQLIFNSLEIPFRKPTELFLSNEDVQLDILQIDTDKLGKEEDMKQIVIDLDPRFKMLEVDDFEQDFQMETQKFQQLWQQMQEGACITRIISADEVLNITDDNMEQLFRLWRIYSIASSEEDNALKIYFYAKQLEQNNEGGHIGLMQFEVNKEQRVMTLTTKCENEQFAGFISKYIEQFLKINDII